MQYDVFISCKREDYPHARQVYLYLREQNYNVFLADTEIWKKGDAEYGKIIDEALDSAKHMIIVATKPEYFYSTYVASEWRIFIEEKRAGRKSGNIITVIKDFGISSLPISLRHFQSFMIDSYAEICAYLPLHEKEIAQCNDEWEDEDDSYDEYEAAIEGYRQRISDLEDAKEENWINEVIAVYDEAIKVARNGNAPETLAGLLRDYALFLRENEQRHWIGTLYEEALSIYKVLAMQNPEVYESEVAVTLFCLACFYHDYYRYDSIHEDLAERKYTEALTIFRHLAANSPKVYEFSMASTLNNLANVHKDTNQLDLAEKEHSEALAIYRRLAANNPEAYESEMANTLHNLAILHSNTNHLDLAEKEYSEALSIYRHLAANEPDTYDSNVAMVLYNQAILHDDTCHYDLAVMEYSEALTIYRRLATNNPEAYESEMANTLNNLANSHSEAQRLDLAEKEYSEALAIFRRLAANNPEEYESKLAMVLKNLAILYCNTQRYELAKRKHTQALPIYRRLAAKNPELYESDVAAILSDLESLRKKPQR